MLTSNFDFIKPYHPELFALCTSAVAYVYSDPQSAVVKLRCFAERYVSFIYEELALPSHGASNFFELLDNTALKSAVEKCVLDKLHLIRMKGNLAAHVNGVSSEDALLLMKEAFFLCAWIYMAYQGGQVESLPTYQAPEQDNPQSEDTSKDLVEAKETLARRTADSESAQAELAAAQLQQQALQESLAENQNALNQVRLAQVQRAGQAAAASYNFENDKTLQAIRMADIFAEYQLTDGQSALVTALDDFLAGAEHNVFLLKGYAGTGKTFITKGLTEYFKAIGRNFVLAAPTGKASKVIAKKTQCQAYTLHKTVYSFKDIKEYKEEDLNGSETYKFYAEIAVNNLSVDTVYIVDEASMISDVYSESEFFRCGTGYLLRDFMKFVNLDHNDHRKKVIFIGDDAQLPPVGMKASPALDPLYLSREYGVQVGEYELTEVVRQKSDSGVMHNAVAMRKSLKENVFNQLDFDLSFSDVEHVDYAYLVSKYLASCNHKINAESIVIAFSNADVAAYNRRIREEFFPGQVNLCPRDKVMATTNSDSHGIFISNGDFGQIRQVLGETEERRIRIKRKSEETGVVEEVIVPLLFRLVEVGFRELDGTVHYFETQLIENLLYSDAPNLSSDENKALYVDFCMRNRHLKRGSLEFKEALRSDPYFNALRLKFGYAITCHKAQGSEWNHVFVKCKTHQSQLCAEYFRWLYTAITRTSKNLYLLDEPHIKLGSGIKMVSSPGIAIDAGAFNDGGSNNEHVPDYTGVDSPANALPSPVDSDQCFGIPASNGFLLALLGRVRVCSHSINAEIIDVQHQQYQEAYFFKRGTDSARLNVSYNSSQKITSVFTPQPTDFSNTLRENIECLKGQYIDANVKRGVDDFEFEEEFLKEFYLRLVQCAEANDITITNVEQKQYSQRYWFKQQGETAVTDIYYNKKKKFTSCDLKKNLSSSTGLLSSIEVLITQGMS